VGEHGFGGVVCGGIGRVEGVGLGRGDRVGRGGRVGLLSDCGKSASKSDHAAQSESQFHEPLNWGRELSDLKNESQFHHYTVG
jgi:hypothetical protein